MLSAKEESIKEKDFRINELEKDLRKYYDNEVLFDQVIREIKINYSTLHKVSFAKEYISNFEKMDTLAVISVQWDPEVPEESVAIQNKKLQQWMETRLKIKHIEIRELK